MAQRGIRKDQVEDREALSESYIAKWYDDSYIRRYNSHVGAFEKSRDNFMESLLPHHAASLKNYGHMHIRPRRGPGSRKGFLLTYPRNPVSGVSNIALMTRSYTDRGVFNSFCITVPGCPTGDQWLIQYYATMNPELLAKAWSSGVRIWRDDTRLHCGGDLYVACPFCEEVVPMNAW